VPVLHCTDDSQQTVEKGQSLPGRTSGRSRHLRYDSGSATAEHSPGFYGAPENLLAVNTLAASDRLAPLDFTPLANATREGHQSDENRSGGWRA
jgi:hypothetical protein